jgi:hypothetical protein
VSWCRPRSASTQPRARTSRSSSSSTPAGADPIPGPAPPSPGRRGARPLGGEHRSTWETPDQTLTLTLSRLRRRGQTCDGDSGRETAHRADRSPSPAKRERVG